MANVQENRSGARAAEQTLRIELIHAVVSDGDFSPEEQADLYAHAQKINYPSMLEILERWKHLAAGKSFAAGDIADIAKSDPPLARTWARIGRDQLRFQKYFGELSCPLLMVSDAEVRKILPAGNQTPMDRLEEFHRLVAALASDRLEGRDAGTTGGDFAYRYLCDEILDSFPNWAIRPQEVLIPRAVSYVPQKNLVGVGSTPADPEDPNAPSPYLFSAPQAQVTAPPIFLPAGDYSAHLQEVKGKIVIFEPADEDFEQDDNGKAIFDSLAASRAVFEQGALGVVVISNTDEPNNPYRQWPQEFSFRGYEQNLELYWLNQPSRDNYLMYAATDYAYPGALQLPGPVMKVTEFAEVYEALQNLKDSSSDEAVTLQTEIHWELAKARNLLAESPTNRSPVVMISAHMDHLGKMNDRYQPGYGLLHLAEQEIARLMHQRDQALLEGKPLFIRGKPRPLADFPKTSETVYADQLKRYGFVADWIYNGAVDNASGCALAILLARELDQKMPLTLAFFTGEEHGLLGSRTLADSWEVYFPNRSLDLLINIDMPAADDPQYPEVIHYRMRESEDPGPLEQAFLAVSQAADGPYSSREDGYPRLDLDTASDQGSFLHFPDSRLLFLTGGYYSRYHAPLDEAGEVDYPKGLAIFDRTAKWLGEIEAAGLLQK